MGRGIIVDDAVEGYLSHLCEPHAAATTGLLIGQVSSDGGAALSQFRWSVARSHLAVTDSLNISELSPKGFCHYGHPDPPEGRVSSWKPSGQGVGH